MSELLVESLNHHLPVKIFMTWLRVFLPLPRIRLSVDLRVLLLVVRWGVTKSLMTAWVLTIPVSALLAAGIFLIVKFFLG